MIKTIKQLLNARSALSEAQTNDLLVEVDKDTHERFQQQLLQIYKDVLSVCEEYSIIAYLVGGSALGAIRHGGFIPWDDDMDIGMTREDYDVFVPVFNRTLSEKYFISGPNISENCKSRVTKIISRENTEDSDRIFGKLCIDLFVIENVPKNRFVRLIKGNYCNLLQFIAAQVQFFENDSPVRRKKFMRVGERYYKTRLMIGKIFSFYNMAKWFNIIDKAARYKKHTGLCGMVAGRKHYFGETMDESVFFPARYVNFCDIKAPVFNNTDAYLKRLYGDYMKLPPENERESHRLR